MTEETSPRAARIAGMEKELAKVRLNIEEQARLDARYALVQRAFDKLRREIFRNLTPEERAAVDGMYLFLHGGNVDMVRDIPSATDRGEGARLEKDLTMREALKELENIH